MPSEPENWGIRLIVESIIAKLTEILDRLAAGVAELLRGEDPRARALVVVPVERPVRIPRRRAGLRR